MSIREPSYTRAVESLHENVPATYEHCNLQGFSPGSLKISDRSSYLLRRTYRKHVYKCMSSRAQDGLSHERTYFMCLHRGRWLSVTYELLRLKGGSTSSDVGDRSIVGRVLMTKA